MEGIKYGLTGYTDEEAAFIIEYHDSDENLTWSEIASEFNARFNRSKSTGAIRKTYYRIRDVDLSEDTLVKSLQSSFNARKNSSKLRKENNILLEKMTGNESILDAIEQMIDRIEKPDFFPFPPIPQQGGGRMIKEANLSDYHIGLKTKSYDVKKARERLNRYADEFVLECREDMRNYTIEKIIININGDLIEGAKMHFNQEFACEGTDAEQVAWAIESIFFDFIIKLAVLGIELDINAVQGNHDREGQNRHIVKPGKAYFTWIIYNSLRLLCQQSKLNTTWNIPEDNYMVYEVYGHNYLLEHGDTGLKPSIDSLSRRIKDRSEQEEVIIKGIRIGHFHHDFVSSFGRYIINGSTVTDDYFTKALGFSSYPCQVVNSYVPHDKNPYLKTTIIRLDDE